MKPLRSPPAFQGREWARSKFALFSKLRDYQDSHDRQLAIQLKIIQQEISP
jgi:hypothetical protein